MSRSSDEVLVVVRLGKTQLAKLRELGDLMSQHGVTPVGFVAVGAPAATQASYDYAHVEPPAALDRLPVRERPRRAPRPAATPASSHGEPPASREAVTGHRAQRPTG